MRRTTARATLGALAACAVLTTGAVACSSSGSTASGRPTTGNSGTTGAAVDPELLELVAGNTAFALDLYRQLTAGHTGNLFFSPHSVSTALAMTYAGAADETARQMAGTLHYTLPGERLHAAFERLARSLDARADAGADTEQGQRFQLSVANALWPQRDFRFTDAFLRVQREDYGAEPRPLDFMNDARGARRTINAWVAEQTRDRIPELLPPGVPDSDTRLVLTNAVYFNASWALAFPEHATQDGPFHAPSGDVTVPLMRVTAHMAWGRSRGVTAVDIPYVGRSVAMTVLLPDPGELAELERELDAGRLAALLGTLEPTELDLTLPRFASGSALSLVEPLQALGMTAPFQSDSADFSGMTGRRDLFLDAVIHQANLNVDEAGTEAAAATAVVASIVSLRPQPEPPRIVVDRPFVYLIRDLDTGAVLFMGRLVDPG
jgi:serpin B